MLSAPQVTVGVPVYQGEPFLEETLRSIRDQTYRDIEVIISLDGPQAAAEALCVPFLKDPRFRMVVQPHRLGWIGNINWLMAQVRTPFYYLHAQDDLVTPRYVETLLAHAQDAPEAAVVYGDIVCIGLINETWIEPSVKGDVVARQLAFLCGHLFAVAFHGLTKLEALRASGDIRANDSGPYAVDTAWTAGIARWGELHRLPIALYTKRIHQDSESVKWSAWPLEKRRQAWIAHCADMLEQAMCVQAGIQDRQHLWFAAAGRLVAPEWIRGFHPAADVTPLDQSRLLASFLEYLRLVRAVALPTWLGRGWDDIASSTQQGLPWIQTTARLRVDLASRERQLADVTGVLAAREREIMETNSSKAWRLALLMRRIRLMLAPPDSRRARGVRAASKLFMRLLK